MKRAAPLPPSPIVSFNKLHCACGSAELIAVAPGQQGERAPGGVMIRKPKPDRAWCAACWPWRGNIPSHPPKEVSA